jgi:ParB family transcriptional regulator, chromosome partitioning protein
MKAKDRILATAGANMNESMGGSRFGGAGGSHAPSPPPPDRYAGLNRVKGAFQIPINRLVADPNQPRKEFDVESLERLSRSLKDRGQLQPIRVRWDGPLECWVIIAGERRWRAAGLAGLTHVAAVEVTAPLSEDEVLEEQLIENCLRDDLKPVEQARAYQVLMVRRGWNQKQLAEVIHVHPSAVTRALCLLELPEPVRQAVEDGVLAPSAAVELARLANPDEQTALAEQVVEAGLNRAEITAMVQTRVGGHRKRLERSKPFRSEFVFENGTVSVTLQDPYPPLRAVVALLKSALAKAQAQVKNGGDGREVA